MGKEQGLGVKVQIVRQELVFSAWMLYFVLFMVGKKEMKTKADRNLKNYKKFQVQLSRADFAKRFNYPVLVFDKDQGMGQEEELGFETVCMQPDQLARMMQQSFMKTASSDVIRLVKKGAKVFAGMVNVGRTSNCDVVIDNPIVSKFHAYFAKGSKDDSYCLIDVNSTNGTYVNKIKLKPKVKKALSDGDTISFDRKVTFSYYTPEGFYDLLAQFSG